MSKFINFDADGNLIGRYVSEVHANIPESAVQVTNDQWVATLDTTNGAWKLVDGKITQVVPTPPVIVPPTCAELCGQIDSAADAARMAVVVDPVRAIEYDRARIAAEEFRDADYPADNVPPMVAAWAIDGRSPRDAALNILAEAAAYTTALEFLRTLRLSAKQEVKDKYATDLTGAKAVVAQTIATIEQAIQGVGNARA